MEAKVATLAGRQSPAGRPSCVASALLVLKALPTEEAEISTGDLARRLGLAKSTVHRLAVAPVSEGSLEHSPDNGRRRPGSAPLAPGAMARRRTDSSSRARSPLRQLGPAVAAEGLAGPMRRLPRKGPRALVPEAGATVEAASCHPGCRAR